MLDDVLAGTSKMFYRRDTPANLAGMPLPRWDLLHPKIMCSTRRW